MFLRDIGAAAGCLFFDSAEYWIELRVQLNIGLAGGISVFSVLGVFTRQPDIVFCVEELLFGAKYEFAGCRESGE